MPYRKQEKKYNPIKYSFGSTSAIITNLALIIGLITSTNAKISIIAGLLVSAFADNISDALGIHIYQESEGLKPHRVWILTLSNFIIRLIISLGFILIIFILPIKFVVVVSLIYGLSVLSIVSYLIAIRRKINPLTSIIEHLTIAVVIIILSNFLGKYIFSRFKRF